MKTWKVRTVESNDISSCGATPIRRLKEGLRLHEIKGQSPILMAEIQKISMFACSHATVLITGARGTGKGLAARALHHLSPRSEAPFIELNCGTIKAELLESHLFGHDERSL